MPKVAISPSLLSVVNNANSFPAVSAGDFKFLEQFANEQNAAKRLPMKERVGEILQTILSELGEELEQEEFEEFLGDKDHELWKTIAEFEKEEKTPKKPEQTGVFNEASYIAKKLAAARLETFKCVKRDLTLTGDNWEGFKFFQFNLVNGSTQSQLLLGGNTVAKDGKKSQYEVVGAPLEVHHEACRLFYIVGYAMLFNAGEPILNFNRESGKWEVAKRDNGEIIRLKKGRSVLLSQIENEGYEVFYSNAELKDYLEVQRTAKEIAEIAGSLSF